MQQEHCGSGTVVGALSAGELGAGALSAGGAPCGILYPRCAANPIEERPDPVAGSFIDPPADADMPAPSPIRSRALPFRASVSIWMREGLEWVQREGVGGGCV